MLTHIVFFKLKERTPEVVQKTKEVLLNMEGKIEQLLSIEVGADVVHSERSYDIALITRFNSLADLEIYNVHPIHKEVIAYMTTVRETSVSVDFKS
ncbi:MAG: Dabb family protein [Paenibacillaceae bacterium]